MTDRRRKARGASAGHVIGAAAFAAISAVEGLKLSPAARRRIAVFQRKRMTPDERRAAVLKAYEDTEGKR